MITKKKRKKKKEKKDLDTHGNDSHTLQKREASQPKNKFVQYMLC